MDDRDDFSDVDQMWKQRRNGIDRLMPGKCLDGPLIGMKFRVEPERGTRVILTPPPAWLSIKKKRSTKGHLYERGELIEPHKDSEDHHAFWIYRWVRPDAS